MLVTWLGILMLVRLAHEENVPSLITVTPSGMDTPLREIQKLKASSPILLTLAGSVMFVSDVQPA